ncbi:hypothetical protein, partial [Escherichia coli]|uniref:hypothetical protein n=1 Tax=Escherichia coli TaxID=562 RepID=UPI001BAEF46F
MTKSISCCGRTRDLPVGQKRVSRGQKAIQMAGHLRVSAKYGKTDNNSKQKERLSRKKKKKKK